MTTRIPDEIISDCLISNERSILLINIRLQKQTAIRKQSASLVKTKIFINGPISKFSMFLKCHKTLPCLVRLRYEGFISPQLNSTLKIEMFNLNNFEVWYGTKNI